MQALLKVAAAGLAATVMLSACSSPETGPETTTAAPAPSASAPTGAPTASAEAPFAASDPAEDQAATEAPSQAPSSESADSAGEGSEASPGPWGRYGDQAHACAAVAANMASLLLVPLDFMTGVEDSELQALQQELAAFSRGVPSQLTDDLDRVEHLLERAAATRDFDAAGFAEALQPVEDWLAEHCGE